MQRMSRQEYRTLAKYKGQIIYAYNLDHLNYLEAFVRADVRIQKDKCTRSMMSTLPAIYRTKKYRRDMLRKFAKKTYASLIVLDILNIVFITWILSGYTLSFMSAPFSFIRKGLIISGRKRLFVIPSNFDD